jgi:DinB superfamily
MSDDLDLLRQTRRNLIRLTADLSDEQLLAIPPGFGNNVLWNYGHCLVTQQRLCYGLSSLPMRIPAEWNDLMMKGTSPKDWSAPPDRQAITDLMLTTVDQLAEDLEAGLFTDFKSYPTSYGVTLGSVEDAVRFDVAHEALHMGVMMALRHLV